MLHGRRSLDPRWIRHHRRVPEGWMIHPIIIYRRGSGVPTLDPVTGEVSGVDLVPIWEGGARIQPNKDWRARYVESANDPQMVHYTRVQIPIRTGEQPPTFRVGDTLIAQDVQDSTDWVYNHDLKGWMLYVRNAQNSSNRWLVNLLCAADLSDVEGGVNP